MFAPLKRFHVPTLHSCWFSEAFLRLSPETPDTPGKADSHEKYLPAHPRSGGISAIPSKGLFSHVSLLLASEARSGCGCFTEVTTGMKVGKGQETRLSRLCPLLPDSREN